MSRCVLLAKGYRKKRSLNPPVIGIVQKSEYGLLKRVDYPEKGKFSEIHITSGNLIHTIFLHGGSNVTIVPKIPHGAQFSNYFLNDSTVLGCLLQNYTIRVIDQACNIAPGLHWPKRSVKNLGMGSNPQKFIDIYPCNVKGIAALHSTH